MDESHFRAPDGALPIPKTFWMIRYFVPRRNLVFQFLLSLGDSCAKLRWFLVFEARKRPLDAATLH
jgi:hypothetical protein